MSDVAALHQAGKFTAGYYFGSLSLLVRKPGVFFSQLPPDIGFSKPLSFLLVSAAFFTAAGLIQPGPNLILTAVIGLINAVGMPFVLAALGFPLITVIQGGRVRFSRFFAVYAFAGGVVLLISWISALGWFIDAAQWILIGLGLVKAFGLTRLQALLLVLVSLGLSMGLFWSLNLAVGLARA